MPIDNFQLIQNYPMGPKVKRWLGVKEDCYTGTNNGEPSALETDAFHFELSQKMESDELKNGDLLTDLIEELVGMNCPLLAIKMANAYPNVFQVDDFRANLHLGNACMLTGDLVRAEDCFRIAQKLVPEEPAPYVNLVQIYCEDGHFETALNWCLAGLSADKNFLRLWEMLTWILQRTDLENSITHIKKKAKELHSWAGASLVCDLESSKLEDPDPRLKQLALDPYYHEGLRDIDFLVEYTAALGMAGQYEKIPAILWQAENSGKKDLPWQLYFHTAQAHFGLSRDDQGLEIINKIRTMADLPARVRNDLAALEGDIRGPAH